MELLDKKVIVTGGASGFGLGIVKKFLNNGAKVVIADQNKTLADEQAQKLGSNAFSIETDVSNEESIENLKKQTKLTIGDPDILVNNAGITHLPDFVENISLDEFEKVLNVNVKSVFLITKAFIPKMKEVKSGGILGYLFFKDIPTINVYFGSVLIIGAGLYIILREAKLGVNIVTSTTRHPTIPIKKD